VVQEAALEGKVAERVCSMPDEEESQRTRGRRQEELEGGAVGDCDDQDGRGEGDEGRRVEEIWGEFGGHRESSSCGSAIESQGLRLRLRLGVVLGTSTILGGCPDDGSLERGGS